MPTDLSLDIRKAVVAHMRADAALISLVPSNRIYGEQPTAAVPDWPFIRYGYPIAVPWEATCYDGSQNRATIHVFADGPGTDSVARIAKAVVASMANFQPALFEDVGSGWLGTNILPDGEEPDKLHAVVEFEIIAAVRG
jgi:hypothetical protein